MNKPPTCIELIDTPYPFQVTLWQVVESDEVVVSWDSVNGAHAHLMEAPEKILSDIDGLL